MLTLENVETSYGSSQVLFGISLTLKEGDLVMLMGRNGMGKTTTVRTITGLTPAKAGTIRFNGDTITQQRPYQIGRAGIALVPEGRQIFPTLSVRENLVATAANRSNRPGPWDLDKVFARFPRLRDRVNQLGNSLSGGEQQMLAIGRALMTNPILLILDEATEGLAPLIRQEIWSVLSELKAEGQTTLVIDKNLDDMARLADDNYVLVKGQVAWHGDIAAMRAEDNFAEKYLGV
ncbi:ABC transporter ATP-binding protein [uncultured Boseongicola sp.]|jgi:branched-chain amino acid transport system ATP-binding protein|uniref:ABC transporter ATP-binding protein n=1 Tax=uncultured Boseongicola sp. TaxID=1648499 RepID=UPI00262FFBA8|nr:ABC transporter ATP-binding protein [uncultured Boseongicola sp.]